MKILVTGGLGYIGSHCVIKLLEADYEVVVLDNLYNSNIDVFTKIKKITNKDFIFINCDLRNKNELETVFKDYHFNAIIHFAGLKAVGESVVKPLEYYDNNILASINLYALAKKYDVKNIIFSSSATVYGDNFPQPFKEEYGQGICTNPYGETKKMNEQILSDLAKAENDFSIIALRYFNPLGAHESGLIGEDPNGIPNNLVPYIARVERGKLSVLSVYGNDYNTPDGTGIRDYIHVLDLANGHVLALEYALKHKGYEVINLGTGKGYSVLEVIKSYEKACGKKINYQIVARREGDIAISIADINKAAKLLNFKAKFDLDKMCEDTLRYNLYKENGAN